MKTPEFYDIYDFIYIPVWKTNTFITIMIILGAILFLITGYIIYKKYKTEVITPLTPQEWALGELTKLDPMKYEKKEDFKKFYFTLGNIYKKYLKKAHKWDVLEKTDQELLDFLREKAVQENHVVIIEKVFTGSLLIKFANAEALKAQAQEDLRAVIALF